MTIASYGKVYNLGHRATQKIFAYPVQVQEKIDGSQFSWGVFDGKLHFRSRKTELHLGEGGKNFSNSMEHIKAGEHLLVPGWTYRGEALRAAKHNTLTYGRAPNGHIALFEIDMGDQSFANYSTLLYEADKLGLDVVPQLVTGLMNYDDIKGLIGTKSFLGGCDIEGVVIKTLNTDEQTYTPDGKAIMAKLVSAEFRERHKIQWGESKPPKSDVITRIAAAVGTDTRYRKGLEKLRDGWVDEKCNIPSYRGGPEDIGPLMKVVREDIMEEEADFIKDELYKYYLGEVLKVAAHRIPSWRKARLETAMEGGEVEGLL